MTPLTILLLAIAVLAVAIAAVLGALVMSSSRQKRQDRRAPLVRQARVAAMSAITIADGDEREAVAALRQLTDREAANTMLDLALSLSGTSQDTLGRIAEEIRLLERARQGTASRLWSRRLYAIRVLTAFGASADDSLAKLLCDSAPEVRAQAATWAGTIRFETSLDQVVAMLGDPNGLCRFAAQDALIRFGLPATPVIAEVLRSGSEDLINQALPVAAAIGDRRLVAVVLGHSASSSPTTRALAASTLARIGDLQATQTLEMLLADPDAEVRRASASALATLGSWPSAPAVERLLNDPAWEVRREAAKSLSEMGAPGRLLLLSSSRGNDPGSEIAIHTLDVQTLGRPVTAQ